MAGFIGTAILVSGSTLLAWDKLHSPALDQETAQAHPTGIPWLQAETDCQQAGRTWKEGTCWDTEHSPDF